MLYLEFRVNDRKLHSTTALYNCTLQLHQEVLEYIKRDIANLALGNKDNHARNTAVQRGFDGRIALTPLYDFAPMYLHPDGIARRIRWRDEQGGRPDWGRVLDSVCALAAQLPRKRRGTQSDPLQRDPLVKGLKAMIPALERIAADGLALGLEPEVLGHLRPALLARAQELAALR